VRGERQVGDCSLMLCHQWWRLWPKNHFRALREVDRLRKNLKTTTNAGSEEQWRTQCRSATTQTLAQGYGWRPQRLWWRTIPPDWNNVTTSGELVRRKGGSMFWGFTAIQLIRACLASCQGNYSWWVFMKWLRHWKSPDDDDEVDDLWEIAYVTDSWGQ